MSKSRPGFIQTTDVELKQKLDEFCEATHREPAPTLRAVLRLFLADGPDVAELRLLKKLWDLRPEDIQAFAAGLRDGKRVPGRRHTKRGA